MHAGQALKFAVGLGAHLLGQFLAVQLFLEILHLAGARLLALTQLLLNGLELLAQIILALGLVQALLDLVLNLGAQLQYLNFAVDQIGHHPQAVLDLQGLHHALALVRADVERAGHHVAQGSGVIQARGDGAQLIGQMGG